MYLVRGSGCWAETVLSSVTVRGQVDVLLKKSEDLAIGIAKCNDQQEFALDHEYALAADGEIPPTKLGIGLHSGPALTGNIGSDARKQYSVTGTTVILASRIEQENKVQGTSLLFSEKSCELASMDPAKFRTIGPVHLKGTAQPILLYTLPNSYHGIAQ